MRDLDSYLAGVFDGEGWVSSQYKPDYHGRRSYSRLTVGVGLNRPDIPQMFADRFGGSVHAYKQKTCTMYQWYLTGSNAIPALQVFADMCVIKGRQAVIALELAGLMRLNRSAGRRPKGQSSMTIEEQNRRRELSNQITALKYADV